jgi:hypothetical protein
MICVFINRLRKRLISILYKNTINVKDLATIYIQFVYKYYRPATTIISNRGNQFVSEF